jgi:ParB family chromosome partitioning protein
MAEYQDIPLVEIREPEVPVRVTADEEAFVELMNSIQQHGIIQPIKVRPRDGKFEVVVGHRRFLAARAIGMETIPATIEDMDDLQVDLERIEENSKRENVNPVDEGRWVQRLVNVHELSQRDVALKLGRSEAWVSLRLKLLDAPEDIKQLLIESQIGASVALELMKITDDDDRAYYAHYATQDGASAEVVRRWVRDWQMSKAVMPEPMAVKQEVTAQREAARSAWRCNFCGVEGHLAYLHNVWICDEELALIQEFLRAYHGASETPPG